MVVWIPAVLAGIAIGSAVYSAYRTWESTKASDTKQNQIIDYQLGSFYENQRYWQDYYKNTGKQAKYPYRSGATYNLSSLYGAEAQKLNNQLARDSSVANVGTTTAYSGLYGYSSYNAGRYKGKINSGLPPLGYY